MSANTLNTALPMSGHLSSLFAPKAVAVVGASKDRSKLGSVMARSLANFDGPVALINSRKPDEGAGIFRSIGEANKALDTQIDLAVLCVPATVCAAAVEDAARAGVRAAIVCAGGFAEVGDEGVSIQRDLVETAKRAGVRLLGPNTSGIIAPVRKLVASFVPGAALVPPGKVAVVAASGGVNHTLAFQLAEAGIGVSIAAGLGNAVDISTSDVLDYVAHDPSTSAVGLHVESVHDGLRLAESVRQTTTTKPVVALVVGRNDVAEFAQSHTGALATSWRTTRAILRQAGAVVVDDERELIDALGALVHGRLTPTASPGVGVVTAQAGPGLLILDALRGNKVDVPELSSATRASLGELLPALTYQRNPVDTGRPGPSFSAVLDAVASDDNVDVMVAYALTEPDNLDLLAASTAPRDIPTLVGTGGEPSELQALRKELHNAGVASYTGPTALAGAVNALVKDAQQSLLRTLDDVPIELAPLTGNSWDEDQAKTILDHIGLTTPRRQTCTSDDDAQAALDAIGGPVAVKILDAQILHKTEIGGVHLNIRTHGELDDALKQLRAGGATSILVEEMAPPGLDLIVGAHRDPVFGPVVLFGLGGTQAEALEDVTLRQLPVSTAHASATPDDLIGSDLLNGWRGGPVLDRGELAHVLRVIGAQLLADPRLEGIEVNPLRLTHTGLLALDAVITMKEE